MGSHAVNVEEDLSCPVCKKPLSSPGAPPKPKPHKLGRGRGRAPHLHSSFQAHRDTRMAVGKFKDNEEIVIAQCGHLFHKFCLRHYCYLVREGRSNHLYKVSCPWCDHHISMSSQAIEYRVHQDRPNDRDRDFTKTKIMNNELSGQMQAVQQKLKRLEASVDDGKHNFDVYRSHWKKLRKELKATKSKRLEIETLYSEVERSEQMLKCMQSQQLKIVRKFILKVRKKAPKDFLHFPRRLAPFLDIIEEDDRLVRDLGEIIVPIHLNHLKSDRQSLLKGIIAAVHEKLVAQGKSIEVPIVITPDQQNKTENIKPSIFVKVRKSSISILSSASLTRDSIQQIVQSVDIPLYEKMASKKHRKKRKVRISGKVSTRNVDKASASDIEVLYMPKRTMVGQASEPCRVVEECDSFAQVPPRKCKSTHAVLVKTKKKKGGLRSRGTSNAIKRSSTATVMAVQSRHRIMMNEGCQTSENNNVDMKAGDMAKEDKLERKPSVASYQEDNRNNSTKETGSKVDINSNYETGKEDAPEETSSVLKLIYDNLEEERKSTAEIHQKNLNWLEFDENQNEVLDNITENGGGSKNRTTALQCTPQFFRVDRRGVPRPESPHTVEFRQPTFLSSFESPPTSDKSFVFGWFQPDEENQLDALSNEERNLIAIEREKLLSERHHYGASIRRPMFHGTPACMGPGVPRGQLNLDSTPPVPESIPFYLRRWQQQLVSSGKGMKTTPRRFPRSTRLVQSPKFDFTNFTLEKGSRDRQSTNSSPRDGVNELSPKLAIRLPPISMYPAKRPTTAQCDNSLLRHCHHREGPEREVNRIYKYDSVWK